MLDCVNMAAEAGKVTPKDTHYVSLLESMFPELQPRSVVFGALQSAKFGVSGTRAPRAGPPRGASFKTRGKGHLPG